MEKETVALVAAMLSFDQFINLISVNRETENVPPLYNYILILII